MPAGRARWAIAAGVTVAVLADAVNGTVFTIARPQMMGDLRATPDEVSWVNLGYLIAKVAVLPAAAWIVDRFGEARTLFWSMAVLVATAIVCTATTALAPLVGARVVQGAGGAALLVAAQTILFRLFPRAGQGAAQAVYALGVVMAPTTLAPALQGWLTDDASWTWAFPVTVALAAAAALCLLPFRTRLPNAVLTRRPFDAIGFGLFGLAMTALVTVLLEGARWNWFDDAHIVQWTMAGAGALIAFIGWCASGRGRSGLFDRAVFANAHFAFGFLVSFVAGFALFGSAFLIPDFALNVLRLPAADAGLLLLPSSLAVAAGLLIAGGLVQGKGLNPVKLAPVGIVFVMTAMWLLSQSNLDSGAHDLGPALLVRGLGLGFLFLAITLIALNGLRAGHVASGVGLFNFGRQMGGIIGIGVLQTYLDRQNALNRRILIENIDPASLPFVRYRDAVAEAW